MTDPETTAALPALTVNHSRKNIESFLKSISAALAAGDYIEKAYSVDSDTWGAETESAKVALDSRTTLEVRIIRSSK